MFVGQEFDDVCCCVLACYPDVEDESGGRCESGGALYAYEDRLVAFVECAEASDRLELIGAEGVYAHVVDAIGGDEHCHLLGLLLQGIACHVQAQSPRSAQAEECLNASRCLSGGVVSAEE